MNDLSEDNDKFLSELLQYDSDLNPQEFTPRVMQKIEKPSKLRLLIMIGFTLLGLIVSLCLIHFYVPRNIISIIQSEQSTFVVGAMVIALMLPSVWLLTSEN